MKNAILAILGVFVLSSAFACSGAPPVSVKTELSFKNYDMDMPEYVLVNDVTETVFVPCVDQVTMFNDAAAVILNRPGFVYRNVEYENHKVTYIITTELMKKSIKNRVDCLKFRDPNREKNSEDVPRCLS